MAEDVKQDVSRGPDRRSLPARRPVPALAFLIFRMMLGCAAVFVRHGNIRCRFREGQGVSLGDGRGRAVEIRIKNLPALCRIMVNPGLAIGETYVDGDWDVDDADLPRFISYLLVNEAKIEALAPIRMLNALRDRAAQVFHANTARRSRCNAAHHYDLGNDLYEAFLDDDMVYSCGFFTSEAQSLDAAQQNKLEVTLDRLQIGTGMRVLDIGCGWGAMTRAIALRDATAVGITLAEQQLALAEQRLPAALADKVSYRLQDYRDHAEENPETYDRVVSIGMFEHVGRRHFAGYFSAVNRLLKPGGRAAVHSIVKPTRSPMNAWLTKYIFPGGMIPQLAEITASAEAAGLRLPHEPFIHDGWQYAKTLRHWRKRFNDNFATLDPQRYDMRFRRLWNFYLASSAAAFEALGYQVAQVIVEKPG
ncbi:cyclopropane-fatty-acyl-phospholipid synthase family protein [Pelagibius sp. CAU 1746]|uniref:cyclopropane-fatty-acyl-phospholipid synthase family protein n=1 Tax=Pelagibius sp. CAU 1746 TaxID=3140370 RepID=UPI00325AC48C